MSEIPFPAGLFIYIGNQLVSGIPVYTAFFALGFMAALFYVRYDIKKQKLNEKLALNSVLIALVFGLFGARFFSVFDHPNQIWYFDSDSNFLQSMYYILFYEHGLAELYPDKRIHGFYEIFFSSSGLVFYGGLIFASIAVFIYYKFKGVPLRLYLDTFSMAAALAYAIGRLGCMISGDGCFGQSCPIDFFPISVVYGPANGLCNNDPAMMAMHPLFCTYGIAVWNTPLIEAVVSFSAFSIIFFKFQNRMGSLVITAIILMQNSATRFLVEFIRLNDAVWPILDPPMIMIDNKLELLPHVTELIHGANRNLIAGFYANWHWYGFTSAQIISIGIFLTGMILFKCSNKKEQE